MIEMKRAKAYSHIDGMPIVTDMSNQFGGQQTHLFLC